MAEADKPIGFIEYALRCWNAAWKGSVALANTWGQTLGVAAIILVSQSAGLIVIFPDTLLGAIGLVVSSVGAAWIVLFVARLIVWAPYKLVQDAQAHAAAARAELARISNSLAHSLAVRARVVEVIPKGFNLEIVLDNKGSAPMEVSQTHMEAVFNGKPKRDQTGRPLRMRQTEPKSFSFEFEADDITIQRGSVAILVECEYGLPGGSPIRHLTKKMDLKYYVANGLVQNMQCHDVEENEVAI